VAYGGKSGGVMVLAIIETALDDVSGHHNDQDSSDNSKNLAEQGLHRISLVVTTNFLYQGETWKLRLDLVETGLASSGSIGIPRLSPQLNSFFTD
jgi:hypothetical protein